MSLEGERVMLLGGAGFIGHHLALELKRKKAEVLIVDGLHVNNIGRIVSDPDLNEARRSLYLNFLLERFELLREAGIPINNSDARLMNEVMRVYLDFMPTKVVHLSAISSAVTAEKDQTFAYDLQITTLRNILDIISSPVSVTTQIMFMSSSTVYGDFESDTVDETVRPKPKGVYANGKFIWPGFGQNMRPLVWIINRVRGRAEAAESPFGYAPKFSDLIWDGLDFDESAYNNLMKIDRASALREIDDQNNLFERLGNRVPSALLEQKKQVHERVEKAAETWTPAS